jgi:hypothetical protein
LRSTRAFITDSEPDCGRFGGGHIVPDLVGLCGTDRVGVDVEHLRDRINCCCASGEEIGSSASTTGEGNRAVGGALKC